MFAQLTRVRSLFFILAAMLLAVAALSVMSFNDHESAAAGDDVQVAGRSGAHALSSYSAAALEGRFKPAALEGRRAPAALEGKIRPAALEGRRAPAALEGRYKPAALEGRRTPAPLEGKFKPAALQDMSQTNMLGAAELVTLLALLIVLLIPARARRSHVAL